MTWCTWLNRYTVLYNQFIVNVLNVNKSNNIGRRETKCTPGAISNSGSIRGLIGLWGCIKETLGLDRNTTTYIVLSSRPSYRRNNSAGACCGCFRKKNNAPLRIKKCWKKSTTRGMPVNARKWDLGRAPENCFSTDNLMEILQRRGIVVQLCN